MLNVLLWSWKHINIHFEYQLKILSCMITGEWIMYVQLPVTHSGFSALCFSELTASRLLFYSFLFSHRFWGWCWCYRKLVVATHPSAAGRKEVMTRQWAAATSREGCARMCWNTLPSWLVCLSTLKSYRVHKMCFSAERLGKRVWVKIWGGSCHRDKQCLREARPVLENSLLQPTHNSSLLPALHIGTAYWKGNHKMTVKHCFQTRKLFPVISQTAAVNY